MRTTMIVCVLFLVGTITVNGTPNQRLKNTASLTSFTKFSGVFGSFNAHRQQNGVALAWTTVSADAVDFTIQHSYDGVHFSDIDHVTPEASGWNRYKDDGALPGYNYYRIVATLGNGSTEYSDVEVVRIVRHK